MTRPAAAPPSPSPADTSSVGGSPSSAPAAVAQRGGGSTHSEVLPPRSPRPAPLGGGDGATAAPGSTHTGASDHPGGSRTPATAGSPIPFDLLLRGWR